MVVRLRIAALALTIAVALLVVLAATATASAAPSKRIGPVCTPKQYKAHPRKCVIVVYPKAPGKHLPVAPTPQP